MHETKVIEAAEKIYRELIDNGLDVLLDDRDMSPGYKFKDADLLGTPLRITVGTRNLKNSQVELRVRSEEESSRISLTEASAIVMKKVDELYDSIR
jgi:prolyl-tRNA synthetase